MIEAFLKRGKLVFILFFIVLIAGGYLFTQLPKRELPEFQANIVTISTIFPGADAAQVERDVTNKLESALSDINGVEKTSSVSAIGFSSIVLEIDDQADFQKVASQIKNETTSAASSFPDGVMEPDVKDEFGNMPVGSYMIVSSQSSDLAKSQESLRALKEKVEDIKGVDSVVIKGFNDKQAVLNLDSSKLEDEGLSVTDVTNAIKEEFDTAPLGDIRTGKEKVKLSIDTYDRLDQIKKIEIFSKTNREPVTISQLGSLKEVEKEKSDIVSYNGKPAYSFTVNIKPGLDIPKMYDKVSDVIEKEKQLPKGVEWIDYYSQKSEVDAIFNDLLKEAIVAVIAVIIVTTLGLTIGGAFIVSLAIPLSITIGTIPLPFLQVDLNQISIIGFIIALGILVDDAIVVNDNILRQMKKYENPLKGTIAGVKEVAGSILTSTLAVVFAFLPLVFLSGANGSFIRALPSVLVTTVLASMVISLTLVPVYQYTVNRKRKNRQIQKEPGFLGKPLKKLADVYADRVLTNIVKRPLLIGLSGLLIATLAFLLIFVTPFEFFPAANKKEVVVTVTLPSETTLDKTNETLEKIEQEIKQQKGIEETAIFAGGGVPNLFNESISNASDHTGQIVVRVDNDQMTSKALIDRMTEPLREEYKEADIFMKTIVQGPPTGAPVTVKVAGDSFSKLIDVKKTLTNEMKDKGASLITDDVNEPVKTISFELNRDRMAEDGLSAQFVSRQLGLVTEGMPLGTFKQGTNDIDLVVKQDMGTHQNGLKPKEIKVPVNTEGGMPSLVPLSRYVKEKETEQYESIPHENGVPTITLKAYPGVSDSFKDDMKEVVHQVGKSAAAKDLTISQGGENENQTQFFIEISLLFAVVLLLIYVTIAFQFNSLMLPLLVLGTVYLAVSGAIIGLFVTQTPFSFMATMGIVSLAGIVVRNAVVLFEFIEQRRKQGFDQQTAVIEAGRARIRPILLTAFTALVALMPVALSQDPLFKPLAICIVSGVFFSTILTLLIVPALYVAVSKKR
ncbi:antiporter [Bacillus australimaris]|uniref:Antiporter n=1 Tax=Bacillus australimaris TaxID=1326968 RepID=A0ABD4QNP6_9BACI|nr:efflux RND transporter permease subunit [Bacillus australimaris]KPN13388.1 antiporter [Bacillus australimaris]MBR8690517.1 efflux RND transporter permease subunit [Bacillus australimaris]